MKSAVVCVLALLCLSAKAQAFCVQTFNTYGPVYALENYTRTQAWTRELAAGSRCALVHLQEAWNADHISWIEEILKPDFTNVFTPNRERRIGLMSLFEGAVESAQTVLFRTNSDGGVLDGVRSVLDVKKAFFAARVTSSQIGEPVWAVNTHLHPTSVGVRIAQIMEMAQWRWQHRDAKLILTGDFNFDPQSIEREAAMLLLGVSDAAAMAWGGFYPNEFCTYCGATNARSWLSGNHVFDYVFVSNAGGSTVTSLRPQAAESNLRGTPGFSYSDHFGLKVDFAVEANLSLGTENELQLEERVRGALETLQKAQRILRREGFKSQRRQLDDIRRSLERREGPFWEAFVASR